MARLSKLSRSIEGKIALVTGAASGMGRATAHLFADEGAHVAVTDLDADKVSRVVREIDEAGGNAFGWVLDVSQQADRVAVVSAIVQKWGGLDILINNAGYLVNKPFEETTLKDFQDVYSTNVFSVAMLTKKIIGFMSESSNVVNISSIGGVQGSMKFSGLSAYSSSKAALNILTENL